MAAEARVRAWFIIGPKLPFRGLSGKLRISDGMCKKYVHEIKDVRYQSMTTQLQDYLAFAGDTGRKFVLWVGTNTRVSTLVQSWADQGKIIILRIPAPGELPPVAPGAFPPPP